jgi:hypothetical protein
MNAANIAAMTAAEMACGWARQGVPVFPVNPDKSPACLHGFHGASCDEAVVQRLFERAPKADRIGMPTGAITGIAVIDVDPAGMTWVRANWRRLPVTRTHKTPRGGWHLFFVYPEGLRSSTGKLALGVDIRARDACITIWGPGYEAVDNSPIAPFPKFVLQALKRIDARAERRRRELEEKFRAAGGTDPESLVRFVERRRLGERNTALYWAACRAGAEGASGEALIAAAMADAAVGGQRT